MLKDMRLLSLSAIAAAVLALLVLLPFGVMAQTPGSPPTSSQESLKSPFQHFLKGYKAFVA